eukprot:g1129.t1
MGTLSASLLLCVALAAAYLAVAAESKCVLDNASCKNHEGADQSACDLCKCTFENKPEKNEILAPATLCGCAYTACKKKCEEDAYVVHPLQNLTSVADLLRGQLGPSAIIYTNECSEIQQWPEIPAALNFISLDYYDEHNTNGTAEVDKDRAFYEKFVYPKLKPHQGVMLVPGIFASDPVHCKAGNQSCPLDAQAAQIVKKLDGMLEWAKNDDKVVGFNPWHYNNRSTPQLQGWWDQRLGAIAMPSVVAKLREIGHYIRNNTRWLHDTPKLHLWRTPDCSDPGGP